MYGSADFYDAVMLMSGIFMALEIVFLIIGLVYYLFQAIGIYKMSKNRGYQHAWLAFIPVANVYVLGGLADNINACWGKESRWRIWLSILGIAQIVCSFAFLAVLWNNMPSYMEVLLYDGGSALPEAAISGVLLTIGTSVMVWGLVAVGALVLQYIVLYQIYRDYTPSYMTYLVLSIVISFFGVNLSPFFLFYLRNKPSASLAHRAGYSAPPQYGAPQGGAPYPPQNPAGQYQPPPYPMYQQPGAAQAPAVPQAPVAPMAPPAPPTQSGSPDLSLPGSANPNEPQGPQSPDGQ